MTRPRPPWALLAALVLLAAAGTAAVAGPALAQDGEDDDRDDHDDDDRNDDPEDDRDDDGDGADDQDADGDDDDEREVRITTSDEKAVISLERETAAFEDEVKITFDTTEGEIEVEYEAENGSTEEEHKLEATFHQLFEYVDENENGRYDVGEEVVGAWRLAHEAQNEIDGPVAGQVHWGPLHERAITADDGTEGHLITGAASFGPNGSATFRLDLKVFGTFAMVNDTRVTPTETKIDITITDYPYQRNQTALGLVLETEAEHELELEAAGAADEDGVGSTSHVDGMAVELFFTWKETATVDGTDRPVHTTVLSSKTETHTEQDGDGLEQESSDERLFVLSYARGDEIVHDPRAGATIQSAEEAASPVPSPGLVALLAGLALVAALVRRAERSWG